MLKAWQFVSSDFVSLCSLTRTNKHKKAVIKNQCNLGTRMIKLENAGLRASRKMSLGSGLHSRNFRAPGLQGLPLWDPEKNVRHTNLLSRRHFEAVPECCAQSLPVAASVTAPLKIPAQFDKLLLSPSSRGNTALQRRYSTAMSPLLPRYVPGVARGAVVYIDWCINQGHPATVSFLLNTWKTINIGFLYIPLCKG